MSGQSVGGSSCQSLSTCAAHFPLCSRKEVAGLNVARILEFFLRLGTSGDEVNMRRQPFAQICLFTFDRSGAVGSADTQRLVSDGFMSLHID